MQNRYRIVRQLGQGGMGTVYEAEALRLNTSFALKETLFTDERLRQQFEREAQLLARLRHPAMPRVFDHFEEGDGLFLVMDFIQGEDLWGMLERRNGPFPQDEVLAWADQLLDVLNYLHTQEPPVIHRDIKPQNLKLMNEKQIVLLDFGLAKGFAGQASRVTTSGSIFGYTPNYAPLEQIQGTGTDPRSDLYALAATLYHLLTGVTPPDALSRASALIGQLPNPLRPADELNPLISPEVASVLQNAMAQHPNQRPASAAAMRVLLKDASREDRRAKDARLAKTLPSPTRLSPPLQPEPTIASPTKAGFTEPVKNEPPSAISIPFTPTIQSPPTSRRLVWIALGGMMILAMVAAIFIYKQSGNTLSNTDKASSVKNSPSQKWELMQTLTGHGDVIWSVALSPDAKTLASGSEDTTLKLWDIAGRAEKITRRQSLSINAVAFSDEGKTLASASNDKTVAIWDVQTGNTNHTLKGHTDEVYTVAFSTDGQLLASGSKDRTIRLWDVQTGALKRTLEGHSDIVSSVAFSADGKTLVSGSFDKTVKLWDVQTGSLRQTFEGHSDFVYGVDVSPDSKLVASGSKDMTIKIWNVDSGAVSQTLRGHNERVFAVAFSPDGQLLASGSVDKTIKLWGTQFWDPLQTLKGHSDVVTSVAFSRDSNLLVSASRDKTIKVWQTK